LVFKCHSFIFLPLITLFTIYSITKSLNAEDVSVNKEVDNCFLKRVIQQIYYFAVLFLNFVKATSK